MPVHKVRGGYRWGKHGKVGTKAEAEAQARAIYANGYRGDGRQGPEQDREDAPPHYVDLYTGEDVPSDKP